MNDCLGDGEMRWRERERERNDRRVERKVGCYGSILIHCGEGCFPHICNPPFLHAGWWHWPPCGEEGEGVSWAKDFSSSASSSFSSLFPPAFIKCSSIYRRCLLVSYCCKFTPRAFIVPFPCTSSYTVFIVFVVPKHNTLNHLLSSAPLTEVQRGPVICAAFSQICPVSLYHHLISTSPRWYYYQ